MLTVEGIMVKSIGFKEEPKKVFRSASFRKGSTESVQTPRTPKKIVLEHSISFKNWELEEIKKVEDTVPVEMRCSDPQQSAECDSVPESNPVNCLYELISPHPKCELDAAAVKLQKVYKSYRTRRNLADCAVVTEELWWKALDFASLELSSILFFNAERNQTAVSRWARARKHVARVGKGLSKDEKAQKLALQHWLEAIDPRHRYGHNLHLYYDVWFRSESTEPFFYWLDVGAGKEINLEKCPRSKLRQQIIKYLGPNEREAYEVIVKSGKLVYKRTDLHVNTVEGSKWIFVLSTTRNLYVGQKKKGTFQHSSFLSGAATTAAGRLVANDGVLKAIWPYSGHYLPTEENFKEFISFLTDNNVDLTDVKKCSVDVDDEYPSFGKLDNVTTVETSSITNDRNEIELNGSNSSNSGGEVPKVDMDQASNVSSSVPVPLFEFNKRLSRKWSSGTGARISCVRDYPADIQARAMEQVNLSPRVSLSPMSNKVPIPSPRPSPKLMISPTLAYMGFPSPRVSLRLPTPKQR